jgi:hypothetical protein
MMDIGMNSVIIPDPGITGWLKSLCAPDDYITESYK